ncbi:MAG: hypothetical protein ILO68_06080, partial [Clostridia bacterium]|nr:hypothetical protein [Clostridia bacterium]
VRFESGGREDREACERQNGGQQNSSEFFHNEKILSLCFWALSIILSENQKSRPVRFSACAKKMKNLFRPDGQKRFRVWGE